MTDKLLTESEVGTIADKSDEEARQLKQIQESRRVWYNGMGQVTRDIDHLLALSVRLTTENAALREQLGHLANFASHTDECEWWDAIPRTICTCGLADIVEKHEFESHQTTVKPRVAVTPTPVEQERRHRKLTHEDDQRLQEAFDSLPECPTEEEAETVLQLCGTSGKEVVNGFIERLLKDRSELQAELDRPRAAPSTSEAIRAAAKEIANVPTRNAYATDEAHLQVIAAILSRWFGKGETRENFNE